MYLAIDLKSFFASVECVERGLNPLNTNLVVADESRTNKTICLAVTPSLKSFGVGARPRLFEVEQQVRSANALRNMQRKKLTGKSILFDQLQSNPTLAIDYLVATPRMELYTKYSTRIYSIYLRHVAPDDIHVYSIDEVFINASPYLHRYQNSAHEMVKTLIREVLSETGITATAGIGTNLYLAKVAMDIVAKKLPADSDGVRIATLDEAKYRRELWNHKPLKSFWRVGRGTTERLAKYGIDTMGKIARLSLINEQLLYQLFGVNAELLIDHAWGREPVTMQAIKNYHPEHHSLSLGQVLSAPYSAEWTRTIVMEMMDELSMRLFREVLVCNQIVLDIGYDAASLNSTIAYEGPTEFNYYGKEVPKAAHGSINLPKYSSSTKLLMEHVLQLFERIIQPNLLVRRVNISVNNVLPKGLAPQPEARPLTLFDDAEKLQQEAQAQQESEAKEDRLREAIAKIQNKLGRNAVFHGYNMNEGATGLERRKQIGGHKA